ncbi:MAG TPA: hypothetical protein VIN75_26025 [Burkholderiaceae bacterium]
MPPRTVVGRNPDVTENCATPGCGEVDAGAIAAAAGLPRPQVPRGWIYVVVKASTLPAAWYCSPPCASRGIALAQLRLTPQLGK